MLVLSRMRAVTGRVFAQVRWSVRQRGLGPTVGTALLRLVGRRRGTPKAFVPAFDIEHGTDTGGLIGGRELAVGHPHDIFNKAYFGVPPSRLRNAVERWRETPGTRASGEYAFVDLGCGKGRAVMVASGLGFREVLGVELNLGLARIAQENVELWRRGGRAAAPIEVVCADATEVQFPEPPLLVYLYNSFQAPVLRQVLKRLEALAEPRGGVIDVLYLVPEHNSVFHEFESFELVWSEGIGISDEDAAGDTVSSDEDRCSLYRRVAGGMEFS